MSWRVGRKVGRTVYDGDTLIGVMDTPELAAKVVACVNAANPPGPIVQVGPASLIVQVGVGQGCWVDVKEPRRHSDNSISFLREDGSRHQTKPGNWRSNGPVPFAREGDEAPSAYARV